MPVGDKDGAHDVIRVTVSAARSGPADGLRAALEP
jgi:hypothetical protein